MTPVALELRIYILTKAELIVRRALGEVEL